MDNVIFQVFLHALLLESNAMDILWSMIIKAIRILKTGIITYCYSGIIMISWTAETTKSQIVTVFREFNVISILSLFSNTSYNVSWFIEKLSCHFPYLLHLISYRLQPKVYKALVKVSAWSAWPCWLHSNWKAPKRNKAVRSTSLKITSTAGAKI